MNTSSKPFNILAVDDSAVFRKLVEHSLSSDERYKVLFGENGREALAMVAKHQPAVVVTDWDMPEIGGLELCRRIRSIYPGFYPYLILLSADTDKEKVVEGLASGADDYLTKPFHAGELVARIEVGLRTIDLHRQIQEQCRMLEEMALTDALTGLPNRRALEVWAPRELSAAARHGFTIWVVMADLDSFKKVNDTYGHDAGDEVLKRFAETLKVNTRLSNFCGRLGGEEFLIVITHTDEAGTKCIVERIRERFGTIDFRFGNSSTTVTASFGVAGFHGNKPPDLNTLMAQADVALYAAKHKGRNRTEFASAPAY
jgi:two-component system, cell cycle response regulator